MTNTTGPFPTPVNQNPDLHEWDLDFNSLRLEIFTPESMSRPQDKDVTLLAFADDWGRIYPRERALIVIECLLAFYNSITDDQIDDFNCDIEGEEGGKLALRMRLERVLFDNRNTARATAGSGNSSNGDSV